MRGLIPILQALLVLTQSLSVAGVLPTGMIEFKSTKGYTYCAGGVSCFVGRVFGFFVLGLRRMTQTGESGHGTTTSPALLPYPPCIVRVI